MSRSVVNAVVVGYDGSAGSIHALEWGAREAGRRRLPLDVMHVWQPPPLLSSGFGPTPMPDSEAILEDAVARVDNVAPDVPVTTRAVPAPVPSAFVEASFAADTIVIGAQGHHRVGVRDFGSTAWQVAIHAVCPVVVVRELPDAVDTRPVVVGADGSSCSALALDYAFDRAASQGVPLVAVHSRTPESLDQAAEEGQPPAEEGSPKERRDAELTEWLRPLVARYPRVLVRQVSTRDQAGPAILRASRGAQQVVVGSRGRGGFRGTLLGSVGMELLRKAACPVAIVRA